MRIVCILWLIVIFFTGCASAPPAPTSVVSKTTAVNVTSETATAVEEPIQKVSRPKATGTEEDARRHFLRGMAALEIAKASDDLLLAIDEFQMATEISPKMAIAWYNLGKAQEQYGLFADAIESYNQYIENVPDAPDAQAVKDEIVKLEFRQEQVDKSRSREGYWMDDNGSRYSLTVDGNKLTLEAIEFVSQITDQYNHSLGILDNSVPVAYQLILHGNQLSGKWSRALATVGVCQVPADTAEVTGELAAGGGEMILHHQQSEFQTSTTSFLGINPTCNYVKLTGRAMNEVHIYGPHKGGGLAGVEFYELLPGYFGWNGTLKIETVTPGTPAYEAGLRDGDNILAIDGAAVKELSRGQAWLQLSGEIGTPLTLEIWRKGDKETSIIKVNRVEELKP